MKKIAAPADEPFLPMSDEAQMLLVDEINSVIPRLQWTFVEPNLPDVPEAVVAESCVIDGWICAIYRITSYAEPMVRMMMLHAARGLKVFMPKDVADRTWDAAREQIVVVEKISTLFNEMTVRRAGERIDFAVDGAIHSMWHPTRRFTGYAWDAMTVGALLNAEAWQTPSSILILGLGGGTVARQLSAVLPQALIVGVEIDYEMISAANKHMSLVGVEVVMGDAYTFLQGNTAKWDVIIDDVYLGLVGGAVRQSEIAREMSLMKHHLSPSGVVLMNVLPPTDADEEACELHFAPIEAAFDESFANVRLVEPARGTNRIVVGGTRLLRTAPEHLINRLSGYDKAQAKLVQIF